MSPQLPFIAPEVLAVLGAEQANRFATEPALGGGTCWDCQQPVSIRVEHSSLLAIVSPPKMATICLMAFAHARCSASEIRTMTQAEAAAVLAASSDASVSAVAALWPSSAPSQSARPVLFISFHSEVAMQADSGERVDMVTAHFLGAGWDLIARMDESPAARPDSAVCQLTSHPETPPHPGWRHHRLELMEDLQPIAEIESLEVDPSWVAAARSLGWVSVYIGPLYVQHWTEGIDQAALDRVIAAGAFVGATVPIKVGP